ncbi:MAG: nitrate- and nitrite sensing domain-containing protein [Alphaproteobacteria bacterium]|nr:nitrate- and nitrite sensing domain-containing protein [Alphaproteobacteria bacterium]
MQFLSKMKLSHMIMLLVVLPLLALTYFANELVLEEYQKNKDMTELGELTNLAVKLSNLVHEQQKERGATAIFVGSAGQNFGSELATQRQHTDKFKQELELYLDEHSVQSYGVHFENSLILLIEKLDLMAGIRNQVDALGISKADAIGYYTQLNTENLRFIDEIGHLSQDPHITTAYISYTSFLQSKERAGIERAVGASGISDGKFSLATIDQFKSLITVQDTYNTLFVAQAHPEQVNLFNDFVANSKDVETMRETIIAGGLEGDFNGLTSKIWFDAITLKINELKKIENVLSAELLADIEELKTGAHGGLWTVGLITLCSFIVIICLSSIIIRSINKSFNTIIARMTDLAAGNLEVDLPPASKNEIGQMIKCVLVFKDNAIEKAQLEVKQQDDKKRAEIEKQQMMNKMADDFDADVGGIVNSVSAASKQLQDTAKMMSAISQTTSENANLVASASEVANSNVQSVAAASEEMSQSVEEINQRVTSATAASKSAVEEVHKTSGEMKNLAATVEKIGGVVSLIASIADQTNLLALNATIESARAGEAGRGFAIVASEVKGLANKTAEATDEISSHIQEVHNATQQALRSMDGIGNVIAEIEEISSSIAIAVEQQGLATQEISTNAQEAADGTQKVSLNIGEVTNASKEADTASNEVMNSATELLEQSNMLKSELQKFTDEVRSTG